MSDSGVGGSVAAPLGKIDLGELPDYFRAVTHRPEANKFLRAAVKAGLRLQQNETAEAGGGMPGAGVQTLQRIKISLRKWNTNQEKNCDTK